MANYLKFEYWNTCDLGNIYYAGGYRNVFYYETEIGKPDYVVQQDTEENGDGVDVITSQVRKKIYQVEIVAPEYVVDALVDMALHDNIVLTYTNGLYSSAIRNVEVIPTWEEITNDCMATVVIRFQQDDQLVDSACCTPLNVLACLEACVTVVGFAADHIGGYVNGQYYIKSLTEPTIQQWNGVAFVTVECASNYVLSDDQNNYMYFNGTRWYEAPEIINATVGIDVIGNTASVHLDGFALPNTFIKAYYSTDGGVGYTQIGSPVTADEWFTAGIDFTITLPVTLHVKVYMYNHNCQYQYSNVSQLLP